MFTIFTPTHMHVCITATIIYIEQEVFTLLWLMTAIELVRLLTDYILLTEGSGDSFPAVQHHGPG